MKKIKYLLTALIMLMIPIFVLAKNEIKGTIITDVKVPEGWRIYTNETLEDMTKWLGLNETDSNNYKFIWSTNSYYFDIVNEEKDSEIILIKKISDQEIDDLSIYEDEEIMKSFKSLEKKYEAYEPKVSIYETNEGFKYYKIEYKDSNLNIIDYITNIHGNMYQYKVQSSIDLDNSINTIEDIIDSVNYEDYLEFVKKNTITNSKEQTSSQSSSIIVIIIFILIIGVGVYVYIILNKRKSKEQIVQEYKPTQSGNVNPAVADFMNPTTQSNAIQQNSINEQNKGDNSK